MLDGRKLQRWTPKLPPIQYWFSGTALFLAGSFVIATAMGLIGIKNMISNTIAKGLMIAALALLAIGWWSAAKQEKQSDDLTKSIASIFGVAQSQQSLSVIMEALRNSQQQVAGQQQAENVIRSILAQYDQLQAATSTFEKFAGTPDIKDRLATADNIISELKVLLGNVQFRENPQALIIRTAPNTFRVTFAVPMRVAPDIKFGGLPPGVTANIIEKSNIGFTVVFTPLTISIDHLP
jgi:hypothetical protein